ncbi:hypothetical protein [Actinophytocola glycyrrhizae]|uniref:Uncharacterized protein n=1 Tax=Actinophytocola glycyrrhizae TaxID=2044873 RepID=A0ABV9RZS8_9PSEU
MRDTFLDPIVGQAEIRGHDEGRIEQDTMNRFRARFPRHAAQCSIPRRVFWNTPILATRHPSGRQAAGRAPSATE